MSEPQKSEQKPQSGLKIALGIFGFLIGLIIFLYLVKIVFKM